MDTMRAAIAELTAAGEQIVASPVSTSPRTRAATLFGCALTLAAGTVDLTAARVHPQSFLAGTTLLATAVPLARGRRWALYTIAFLASLSVALHFVQARDAIPFNYAIALLGTAVFLRHAFTLPSPWSLSDDSRERARALSLVSRFGRSGQDFFKTLADKSLFFTTNGSSFVGYRVAHSVAIALGDPVGPPAEIPNAIREFVAFCRSRGWSAAFHQTGAEFLSIYESLGFRHMKVGEDGIVDLTEFTTEGSRMKEIRKSIHRLERAGVRVVAYPPGAPEEAIREARAISDEWLRLPGRRERRFTLGQFSEEYLASTSFFVAYDAGGKGLAFVNLAPSYAPGLATMDLMRRRVDAPNGIIDYLFVRVFAELKAQGYTRVNLGMAPLCGFADGERPHWDERLVHRALHRFSRVLSFQGLCAFKAKYATSWQPRYTVYGSPLSLPKLGLALRGVTEIDARH
jgi:phosphatidylglycerol lysyltransferase